MHKESNRVDHFAQAMIGVFVFVCLFAASAWLIGQLFKADWATWALFAALVGGGWFLLFRFLRTMPPMSDD